MAGRPLAPLSPHSLLSFLPPAPRIFIFLSWDLLPPHPLSLTHLSLLSFPRDSAKALPGTRPLLLGHSLALLGSRPATRSPSSSLPSLSPSPFSYRMPPLYLSLSFSGAVGVITCTHSSLAVGFLLYFLGAVLGPTPEILSVSPSSLLFLALVQTLRQLTSSPLKMDGCFLFLFTYFSGAIVPSVILSSLDRRLDPTVEQPPDCFSMLHTDFGPSSPPLG